MSTLHTRYPSLTTKQLKAVAALATGSTMTSAAKTAGVDRTTLYAWRQNDEFDRAITDARLEAAAILMDDLKDTSALALNYVRNLITDESAPHSVRLKAALAVLNRLESTSGSDTGWALPQNVKEADNREIERKLLGNDYLRHAKTPRREPVPTQSHTQQEDRPFISCHCGSGLHFDDCCYLKASLDVA